MDPSAPAPPTTGTWQLPVLGQAASEAAPAWIVDRMLSGEIVLNGLGGFTVQGVDTARSCVAGDIVRLMPDDTLVFERPEDAAVH